VLHIARDTIHCASSNRLDADPTCAAGSTNRPIPCCWPTAWRCRRRNPGQPHSQRWQYLTSLYLQQPLGEVQQQVHQQAANSARDTVMPDLWHPALSLIWPWHVQKIHHGLPAPPPPPKPWRYGANAAPSCWWSRAASPTPCT
jgi:hypothetical protein